MKPRQHLPGINDAAQAQFLSDWWSGWAVGLVTGLGAAVMALAAVRGGSL